MDLILLLIGFLCMLAGIAGSFLPAIPGLPLSWFGLVLLYATNTVPTNYWILGITLIITVIISVFDYFIPAQGAKKFGGSSYGIWGTNIGLIIGLLSPLPFGFLIGAFVGALIGELVFDATNHKRALKAATGSFIGFLASTFIQFFVCCLFLGLFISIVWQNKAGLFLV